MLRLIDFWNEDSNILLKNPLLNILVSFNGSEVSEHYLSFIAARQSRSKTKQKSFP
jgi:hypothetical protein